jgi:hypothetical protein
MNNDFLSTAFSEKLFDFVILKSDSLQSVEGLSSTLKIGDWVLHHSSLSPVKSHCSAQGLKYFFLGTVFELNQLTPINSIGHYVGLEYNPNEKTMCIFRSRNSFLGIYYSIREGTPLFWGSSARIKHLVNYTIDTQAVETFFEQGIVSNGMTLFKEVHQLGFQKRIYAKGGIINEVEEPSLRTDSPLTLSPEQFLEFTMERFSHWFRHCSFNSFAVSGGADSRLLLATLLAYPVDRKFSLHSRCHPELDPVRDADVVVAQRAAALMDRKHFVQRSTGFPSAYLSQEAPAVSPIMSGLYGGELLGGELLQLVPRARFPDKEEGSFSKAVAACAQMFLCDFYGGAWVFCSGHHNLTLTPYWDSYFVGALLQTPTSLIQKYSLMSKMYEHLPLKVKELPFVSILTDYQPQWFQPLPGLNPKTMQKSPTRILAPSSWQRYKKQLTDENYYSRVSTLWYYFKEFYSLEDEELRSIL